MTNFTCQERIGKIMAADDQLINLEVLKRQLTEVGLHEKTTYCIDGMEVIEKSKMVLEEAIA